MSLNNQNPEGKRDLKSTYFKIYSLKSMFNGKVKTISNLHKFKKTSVDNPSHGGSDFFYPMVWHLLLVLALSSFSLNLTVFVFVLHWHGHLVVDGSGINRRYSNSRAQPR